MGKAAVGMPARTDKSSAHHFTLPGRSRPGERLRTEIDRLFDDFLRGYWHIPFRNSAIDVEPYWRGEVTFGATPAVDIVERNDGYKLTAELPGLDPHNVGIRFADSTLTIEGDKEQAEEDEKLVHFLSERRYGAFHRSFRVPDGVDADKIEANFKNGILTVTLPKTAEARKQEKTIAVRAT
jgi:HSP20 family protein